MSLICINVYLWLHSKNCLNRIGTNYSFLFASKLIIIIIRQKCYRIIIQISLKCQKRSAIVSKKAKRQITRMETNKNYMITNTLNSLRENGLHRFSGRFTVEYSIWTLYCLRNYEYPLFFNLSYRVYSLPIA